MIWFKQPWLAKQLRPGQEIFVAGDPGAGMQAFLVGKVKIQGDFAKVMAAGTAGPIGNPELAEALQAITS